MRFLTKRSEDHGEHILLPVGIAPRGEVPFQLYVPASRLMEWAKAQQRP